MLKAADLTTALMSTNATKNNKVVNPINGGLIFGKIPVNPTGIPSGCIYLRLGYVGKSYNRAGAFGARHIWEKHKTDLNITTPENTPLKLAQMLTEGLDVLYEDANKPVVLNTSQGIISLQLKKSEDGINEYSIVSAYYRTQARGIVFCKLEKP